MRVLLIVTGFPGPNDLARSVFNLRAASYLSEVHDLSIIRLRSWKPGRVWSRSATVSGLSYLELAILNHPYLSNRWSGLSTLLIKISSWFWSLPGSKPEVIHCVGGSVCAMVGSHMSQRLSIPYLTQYIGSDLNFYLKKNHAKPHINRMVHGAGFHTFNSEQLLRAFQQMYPDIDNTRVIYRGVDLSEFRFNEKPLDELKCLFLGGFVSDDDGQWPNNLKGGITLLKAWNIFTNCLGNTKATLTLCGPNTDGFDYENYLEKPGLESITALGAINRQQVLKQLANSNLVIVPSLFEGLPNVIYEAMATGNMVIGTEVGGIPEMINDQVNGLIVPPNDAAALSQALDFVSKDPLFLEKAIKTNQKHIQKFDKNVFVTEYSKIYKRLANF